MTTVTTITRDSVPASSRMTVAVFHERTGWMLPGTLLARIREAAGPSVAVMQVSSRAELIDALPSTTDLIGLPLTAEQVSSAGESLRWIQLTNSTGDAVVPLLTPEFRDRIRISSAASMRAPQVAEHAMALALALVRRLDHAFTAQTEHDWAADAIAHEVTSLHGATVGILAAGPVGQAIAARVRGFGATTIALQTVPGDPYELVDEILPPTGLEDLLGRSDVLFIATPRAGAGASMIGKRQLQQLRPTALLVNVSRSGIIDEAALLDALRRRKLAGAALDVFETEPLPASSPLWTMRNVIITPRISAAAPRYWEHATEIICKNIRRLAEGRPLIDEIEPGRLEAAHAAG